MTNDRLERISAKRDEIASEIESKSRKIRNIEAFLNEVSDTGSDSAEDELEALREHEKEAKAKLDELKRSAAASTHFSQDLRKQVDNARKRLLESETNLDAALEWHRDAQHKLDAVDGSLAQLSDVAETSQSQNFSLELLYSTCPACSKDLSDRALTAGRCSLCTEPLPDAARAREKDHLEQKRRRLATSAAAADKNLTEARDRTKRTRNHFDKKIREMDERTLTEITPHVDSIARATADLESIRSTMSALQRMKSTQGGLADRKSEVRDLKEKRDTLEEQKNNLQAELNNPEEVVESINTIFRHIVDKFQLPWATGRARLDPQTLLPMVDEQDFSQRGGGSRTAVSVAYSLALLMYALEHPSSFRMPPFLILDAPQKNMGRNDHDRDLAARMYQWVADYFDQQRHVLGGRYTKFQLIILDNDIPEPTRRRFNRIIQFSGTGGFVRDLENPHGDPGSAQFDDDSGSIG